MGWLVIFIIFLNSFFEILQRFDSTNGFRQVVPQMCCKQFNAAILSRGRTRQLDAQWQFRTGLYFGLVLQYLIQQLANLVSDAPTQYYKFGIDVKSTV